MTEMSQAAYRHLLGCLLAVGYRCVWFGPSESISTSPAMWLRHDIDFSLEAAVKVAEWEHDIGVRATYFVQTRSELYNLATARASRQLATIVDLGHQIGLHIDLDLYGPDALVRGLEAELAALQLVAPSARTDIVSLHRPGQARFGVADVGLPAGVAHTYEPRFVTSIEYFADSGGKWRNPPLASDAFRHRRDLHVLVHPMWWTTAGGAPISKLQAYLDDRRRVALDALATNTVSHDLTSLRNATTPTERLP